VVGDGVGEEALRLVSESVVDVSVGRTLPKTGSDGDLGEIVPESGRVHHIRERKGGLPLSPFAWLGNESGELFERFSILFWAQDDRNSHF
jgi:hypothetical protein